MLKRPKYCVVRFSIFLIALCLIAGTVACSSGPSLPGFTPRYSLRISSTIGGTVTTPGEGIFYYPQGTTITVVAQPDLGYRFVCWVGNVDTIVDSLAATTTVTVNYHCFLIAQFKEI